VCFQTTAPREKLPAPLDGAPEPRRRRRHVSSLKKTKKQKETLKEERKAHTRTHSEIFPFLQDTFFFFIQRGLHILPLESFGHQWRRETSKPREHALYFFSVPESLKKEFSVPIGGDRYRAGGARVQKGAT
jgi:hypothetical protein